MTPRASITAALLASAFTLGGCADEAGATLTLETYPAQWAQAYCESNAVCPELTEKPYPISVAVALMGLCEGTKSELTRVVSTGHVRLDAAAAQLCLEQTRACEAANSRACEVSLTGTQQEGQSCQADSDCASRSCRGGLSSCGVCDAPTKPSPLGGECSRSRDCDAHGDDDVRCLRTGSSSYACTVVRKVELGGSCAAVDALCSDGTYCARDGKCHAPKLSGERCDGADRCEYGSLCSYDASHEQQTCVPIVLRDLGETCVDEVEQQPSGGTHPLCDFGQGLLCVDETHRCGAVDEVDPGADCGGLKQCSGELFCNEQRHCEAPRANGKGCSARGECASGYCGSRDQSGKCISTEDALSCP